jgi:hypothetical protein
MLAIASRISSLVASEQTGELLHRRGQAAGEAGQAAPRGGDLGQGLGLVGATAGFSPSTPPLTTRFGLVLGEVAQAPWPRDRIARVRRRPGGDERERGRTGEQVLELEAELSVAKPTRVFL